MEDEEKEKTGEIEIGKSSEKDVPSLKDAPSEKDATITFEESVSKDDQSRLQTLPDSKKKTNLFSRVKWKKLLRKNLLILLMLAGIILGGIIGYVLRITKDPPFTKREVMYIRFVGELFLRVLKMIILPLIVASLIAGIGSIEIQTSRAIGIRALLYYLATTLLAVVLGIILVMSIRPGDNPGTFIDKTASVRKSTTADTLLDLVRNLFPENLVQACFNQYVTVYIEPPALVTIPTATNQDTENSTSESPTPVPTPSVSELDFKGTYGGGTNYVGLVLFAVIVGFMISIIGSNAHTFLVFFIGLNEIIMLLVSIFVWLAPIGILFLVIAQIIQEKDFAQMFQSLGMYFATVIVGLLIHACITLPIIYFLVTRANPLKFIANISEVLLTAFATSSSSATLPITIRYMEEKNKVDSRITRFVLPIGATVNMDGTALYEAVAVLFVAQVRSVDMDIGKLVAVSITATAASIGAAGIPQAGLVTMVMVLETVGLPSSEISLILSVDWLLDRFRTTVNVLGDCFGAGIIGKLLADKLSQIDSRKSASAQVKM